MLSNPNFKFLPALAFCYLACCLYFNSPAVAQVNGSGVSDAGLFTNVFNVLANERFRDPIGGVVGETTQLNLNQGGVFGARIESGAELNVFGGTVITNFGARSGSEVNIVGGTVAAAIDADAGSEINISGGTVANFEAFVGSDVELIGAEFRLNGSAFSGSAISLSTNDVFTGTLSDGSSFIFSESDGDELSSVTLTVVPLLIANPFPVTLSSPVDIGPSGLRAGQTLTISTGGSLARENFAVVSANLNVEAGVLGDSAEVFDSIVNISGGEVGSDFTVEAGSVVEISGGEIGFGFKANNGSVVNISGGTGLESFNANDGSVVNISGGTLGRAFDANAGSVVNISGGTLGENFENSSGSNVELIGGEFRINGEVYSGGTINSIDGDVFTGTLADGSPFIFLDLDPGFFLSSDSFLEPVTLTSVPLAPADTPPMQVDSGSSDKPTGLRPGQDLTLQSGGELDDNFEAVGAILRIRGGILGEGATVVDSTVSISHGELDDLTALSNSVVNYRRGDVSELNIVDSQLNILGGAISRDISRLQVGDDSFVTLFGTEFFLNGAPIPFFKSTIHHYG